MKELQQSTIYAITGALKSNYLAAAEAVLLHKRTTSDRRSQKWCSLIISFQRSKQKVTLT